VATPRKEFTTYPKKFKELLLMLKEDGSFQQYNDDDNDEATSKTVKGTWDYLDGQLILATDRSTPSTFRDTILVGKVVAKSQNSLPDNPLTKKEELVNATQAAGSNTDTHLSVPQGSVKVGKFMYPKHHPSFFEQPIFRPVPTGSFELRQVLGSLNAREREEEDELVEKFRRTDFYEKRFFLTSHPIEHKPKGHLRWSIKYNKFVEDAPRKKKETPQDKIPIRVMELLFHTNNTFSTVAGLGEETILRGKWDIIGNTRNQLWMQVWRFGFGRSVSGSVYSEGKGLSDDDDKTYWGEISYIEKEDEQSTNDRGVSDANEETSMENASPLADTKDDEAKRLQVKGSVMYGWGLEPQPVARFIMKESLEKEVDDDEEEEEEDTREEDLERTFQKDSMDDNDIDWDNAFQ
jgi:hypothetical protein